MVCASAISTTSGVQRLAAVSPDRQFLEEIDCSLTLGQLIQNNTLSFGATCANGTSQCNSTVELTCTGSCVCRNAKVWNISSCVCPAGTFLNATNLCRRDSSFLLSFEGDALETALTINQTCLIGSNQCDSTKNLLCNNSRCQCDLSTRYWNINFQTCCKISLRQRLAFVESSFFSTPTELHGAVRQRQRLPSNPVLSPGPGRVYLSAVFARSRLQL